MKELKIFLGIFAFLGLSLGAKAQDTIRFTWEVRTSWSGDVEEKMFTIMATNGKTYTVNWGDGVTDTIIGTGIGQIIQHTYAGIGTHEVIITTTNCLFTYLDCSSNGLNTLDIGSNMALETLQCQSNQLTALDLSTNTAITYLNCSSNPLTTLDISSNTVLETLWCNGNKLTNLDVNANVALKYLRCDNNQLTTLDVHTNTVLEYLFCFDNQLIALDVHANIALIGLECHKNQLKVLDVSANTALTHLFCNNNCLPLSNLFAASEKITNPFAKQLGLQNLLPRTVMIGDEIDYSDQNIFKGIYTQFAVTKNGSLARQNDYTLTNGKITFKNLGNYTVTMTNSAIVSNPSYSTKVIVEIEVVDELGIVETHCNASLLRVYPNPAKNQLIVDYGRDGARPVPTEEYAIYSVVGQVVLSSETANNTPPSPPQGGN